MRVSPINTNNNTHFRATIQPSESLQNGFTMIRKYANSGCMKDLNSVKDFVDSIARISESKKAKDFKIEIDRQRQNYTYTKINGRRVRGGDNQLQPNLQDAYLVVEGTKKYASKLEAPQPSILDAMKAEIEAKIAEIDELKERYSQRLKDELEYAQKMIFNNGK